jgi:outer membrane protein OmpA-like peptidoglycan-associated protein
VTIYSVLLTLGFCLASTFSFAQSADEKSAGEDWVGRLNLGPAINSEYSDLFPIISPDEQLMFFTRKGSPENRGYSDNPDDEDIWFAQKDATGMWRKAARMDAPLNSAVHDGVRAINVTATRLYLQNVYLKDGSRRKGFSVSERDEDGNWGFPLPLLIEDYYNESNIAMLAVSQSEDVLILAVQRKDGMGKQDLYVSKRTGERRYSKPQLIPSLSSEGSEVSPFIAFDDRTIYFSTDGRGGFGQHDIFISRRLDSTWFKWSEPMNLGSKVNTIQFDAYFTVAGKGDTAYFSSVHRSSQYGYGRSDIWKSWIPEDLRPGYAPKITVEVSETDSRRYDAEDYLGSLWRLDSVYFDQDKSSIREDSRKSLMALSSLLEMYPLMRIEVQGHTDNDGTEKYNMDLSLFRARAVRDFIIGVGVDGSRIEAVGYGEKQPIAPNDTEEGKQLNRRVMVLVRSVK